MKHLRGLPSYKAGSAPAVAKYNEMQSRFRNGKLLASDTSAEALQLREEAYCYATLVSSISELTYLRSLDAGEKLAPRDLVHATARRVGFEIPTFSDKTEFLKKNVPFS